MFISKLYGLWNYDILDFFTIILGLTAMASSTMTIQLTSIKYMYICGASYFFVGIILLIVNAFLKKKNRYHYYY